MSEPPRKRMRLSGGDPPPKSERKQQKSGSLKEHSDDADEDLEIPLAVLCNLSAFMTTSPGVIPASIMTYIAEYKREHRRRNQVEYRRRNRVEFPSSVLANIAEFASTRKAYNRIARCRKDVHEICKLMDIKQWPVVQMGPESMNRRYMYDIHLSADFQWLYQARPSSVRARAGIEMRCWNVHSGEEIPPQTLGKFSGGVVQSPDLTRAAGWNMRTYSFNLVLNPMRDYLTSIVVLELDRLPSGRVSVNPINQARLTPPFECNGIEDAKFLSDNILFVRYSHPQVFALWDLEKRTLLKYLNGAPTIGRDVTGKSLPFLSTRRFTIWTSEDGRVQLWNHCDGDDAFSMNDRAQHSIALPEDVRFSMQPELLVENPTYPLLVAVVGGVPRNGTRSPHLGMGLLALSKSEKGSSAGMITTGQYRGMDRAEATSAFPVVAYDTDFPFLESSSSAIFNWFKDGEYAYFANPMLFHGVHILRLCQNGDGSSYFKKIDRADLTGFYGRFYDKLDQEFIEVLKQNRGYAKISHIGLSEDGKAAIVASTSGRVNIIHI